MTTRMRIDHLGRSLNPLVCSSAELADALSAECDWFTGVPDSVLKNLLPRLEPYVLAPAENHAVGLAFGARAGGRRPCVLIQNSGLGLCGDAIFGLLELYKRGVLFVVVWRGELSWEEPQHRRWGAVTPRFLDLLGIESFDFEELGLGAVAAAARVAFVENRPACVLVRRGNLDE
jgi:sulfopyruvate decarboxylase TPP-binding subunit